MDRSKPGVVGHLFSNVNSLRPWPEVQRLWNQRSGQNISKQRVVQIADVAHKKLKAALRHYQRSFDE